MTYGIDMTAKASAKRYINLAISALSNTKSVSYYLLLFIRKVLN